ncbi:MAG: ribonuclease P protein component 1 [Hadesarchaea archaeon]|nr:ribonuclease P protein component 1 [Hadesarchaea archaeon]
MPITKRNVLRHELIGLEARVVNSSDPNLIGISGTIIDETRNMLVIEQMERPKMVPKANSIFRITLPDGEEVEVEGTKLVARPEERVKKRG